MSSAAVIICDMWNAHWSEGATRRVNELAPKINSFINKMRDKGALIIHAPSNVTNFYSDTPAYRRAVETQLIDIPVDHLHKEYPLPIDDSDGGSDTGETEKQRVWTRQHSDIDIDQEEDFITDEGIRIYNIIRQAGIERVYILGVHTNMCILHRSFGIKQMVKWGVDISLVKDLTDAMYNPKMPPYVSHEEGTKLVIDYIAKYWCPTLTTEEILSIR
jgi:nicotinamidase-related amidase